MPDLPNPESETRRRLFSSRAIWRGVAVCFVVTSLLASDLIAPPLTGWNWLSPGAGLVQQIEPRSSDNTANRFLFGGATLRAEEKPAPAAAAPLAPVTAAQYVREIKPLFRDKCFACHGALKQLTGLRVDSRRLMLQGGQSGPAIDLAKTEESPLLERLVSNDPAFRMPFEATPLTAAQIDLVRRWIAAGAPAPENEQPEADPREHWSFRTPVRPAIPPRPAGSATDAESLSPNPIDAFIEPMRLSKGLSHTAPASPELLLRRVTLDLIGLPPTPEQLQQFLADPSDKAYEQYVDRLLASPQYGERWARHWMDVWRYADWFGRRSVPDVWNSAPQIWRWRDWIIQSLNADKGYDRMVQEMLAADEIAPGDQQALVATGYLARNWYALNHNQWMRENVEHTAKAFLGLTFNCAHCHDHKYDPIAQTDYFRFRAFFEPIGMRQDRIPGEAEPGPYQEYQYLVLRKIQRLGSIGVYDRTADATTWFYTGGDERNRVTDRGSIPPGVPAVFDDGGLQIAPVTLPPVAWRPGSQDWYRQQELSQREQAVREAESLLKTAEPEVAMQQAAVAQQLQQAQDQFDQAVAEAVKSGQQAAISGRQSLLLDSGTGRRIINQSLAGTPALVDGVTLSLRLRILKDAHFNLQLARDAIKGLTAGMIVFEAGKIRSYQPGGFNEFEIGQYDPAATDKLFTIRFEMQPTQDRALLTVLKDGVERPLADAVPVALNQWNSPAFPDKTISLDARTGSQVAIDDLVVRWPAGTEQKFDFEPPVLREGMDVVGQGGWTVSTFGAAPGQSYVTAFPGSQAPEAPRQLLLTARRAQEQLDLKRLSAQTRLQARQAAVASLQARIAADDAQIRGAADAAAQATAALQAERASALLLAELTVREKRLAVLVIEAKPASDMNRAKELDAETKALAAAQTALAAAQAMLQSPLTDKYTPLGTVYPAKSTGRRAALARWITSPRNPLAARVAINHLWNRHFHQPLVATVFDFGRSGKRPTHPELLDWLAVELMESGWRMKPIHRLIVTSQLYRQSSNRQAVIGGDAAVATAQRIDPENQFYWRMPTGRMEAEVVRDSVLFAAGQLDLKMGGQELENTESLTTFRRSVYYSCYPEIGGKSPLGELFDGPDANECYRRSDSIIPQQALALTNSPLMHDLSARVAQSLGQAMSSNPATNAAQGAVSDPETRLVTLAFERILSRNPTARELELCRRFLSEQQALLTEQKDPQAEQHARESLLRALFNHNDFVTIR